MNRLSDSAVLSAAPARTPALLASLIAILLAVISPAIGAADAPPATAPSPLDAEIASIQAKLQTVRDEAAKDAADRKNVDPVALGFATPAEAQERDRLLPRIVRSYEKHLEVFARIQSNQQTQQALDTEIKSWHGFDEKPPYTIDLKDSLRESIRSSEVSIKAIMAERTLADTSLSDTQDRLAASQSKVRGLNEQIEREGSVRVLAKLRWRHALEALRVRSAEVSISLAQLQIRMSDEALATENQRLAFLKRKLSLIAGNTAFTEDLLNRKLEMLDTRAEAARTEIQKATAAGDAIARELADAQAKLRLLQANPATQPAASQPAGAPSEIDQLRARIRLLQVQAETSTFLLRECLRPSLDTVDYFRDLIKTRHAFLNTADRKEIDAVSARFNLGLSRVALWKNLGEARQEAINSLIRQQNLRVLTWPPNAPFKDIEQQILDSYRQRDIAWRDRTSRIEAMEHYVMRCQDDLAEMGEKVPLTQRLRNAWGNFADFVSSIWNFEIFSAEDAITIDGRTVVGKRSITVNKVLMAFLALTLGLSLCRRITAFFSRRVLPRIRLEQSTRVLFERLLYMGLMSILAIFALTYFKIPLTVFAFLGGALAIGIGFGAQNLINNFISGLILLVERPIRLGDLVEVDDQMGHVAAIGSRCSRVKLLNGIDMLIPNSSLLEHQVTNWTLSDRNLRCAITVGVAYGSAPRQVSSLIARAVAGHPQVKSQPAPEVLFSDFGDNALMFRAQFWIELVDGLSPATIESEARHRVSDALTQAGIEIPFPQRDVNLSSVQPVEVRLVRSGASAASAVAAESLLR